MYLEITNTLAQSQQNKALNRLADIINYETQYIAIVHNGILYCEGVRVYFNNDNVIAPWTLPKAVRTVILEMNAF